MVVATSRLSLRFSCLRQQGPGSRSPARQSTAIANPLSVAHHFHMTEAAHILRLYESLNIEIRIINVHLLEILYRSEVLYSSQSDAKVRDPRPQFGRVLYQLRGFREIHTTSFSLYPSLLAAATTAFVLLPPKPTSL